MPLRPGNRSGQDEGWAFLSIRSGKTPLRIALAVAESASSSSRSFKGLSKDSARGRGPSQGPPRRSSDDGSGQEYGYRDGSAVHRDGQRLEARANNDRQFARRLEKPSRRDGQAARAAPNPELGSYTFPEIRPTTLTSQRVLPFSVDELFNPDCRPVKQGFSLYESPRSLHWKTSRARLECV